MLSGGGQQQAYTICSAHTSEYYIPIESMHLQVNKDTSINELHQLFITLKLNMAVVTEKGRLVGLISREDLVNAVVHADDNYPLQRRKRAKKWWNRKDRDVEVGDAEA